MKILFLLLSLSILSTPEKKLYSGYELYYNYNKSPKLYLSENLLSKKECLKIGKQTKTKYKCIKMEFLSE